MKKFAAILFILCLCFSLASCGKTSVSSTTRLSSEEEKIPAELESIRQKFEDIANTYTVDFEVNESISPPSGEYLLEHRLRLGDETIYFLDHQAGPTTSFYLKGNPVNKDYIISFFLATNPDLTWEQAVTQADSLQNACKDEEVKYTPKFENGDYFIFSDTFKNLPGTLFAFHKDDIYGDPAIDDFVPMDYEAAKNTHLKENMGKKFILNGQLVDTQEGFGITHIFQDAEGRTYSISQNDYEKLPFDFVQGQIYTIYVITTENYDDIEVPNLDLQYVQPQ